MGEQCPPNRAVLTGVDLPCACRLARLLASHPISYRKALAHPMIIESFLLPPSGPVLIDAPFNLNRADPTGAVQCNAEHPARNRKCVGSRPVAVSGPRSALSQAEQRVDRGRGRSFPQSFHQALLQPTRPHSTECRPNLSCLDPTGTV